MDEPTPPASPRTLSALELQRRLAEGEPFRIVDVREDQELAEARLPHPVVHLPLSRSREWIPELETLIDRQQPVVVLCHAGIRSWHFACWLMQEQGYGEVWNLQGGIDAWSREVDPQVPRY